MSCEHFGTEENERNGANLEEKSGGKSIGEQIRTNLFLVSGSALRLCPEVTMRQLSASVDVVDLL